MKNTAKEKQNESNCIISRKLKEKKIFIRKAICEMCILCA